MKLFKRKPKGNPARTRVAVPMPDPTTTINRLLQTEDGLARIGAVLSEWAAEDQRQERKQGLARMDGYTVRGDDLIHPTLGTFVGAAKNYSLRNRNPLVS